MHELVEPFHQPTRRKSFGDQRSEHREKERRQECGWAPFSGYVPEHDETVPARWNATKVKVFRKRSSEIAKVVDDARIEGRTTVRVVAK